MEFNYNKHKDLFVKKDDSILFVLKKMDQTSRKLLLVFEDNRFSSLISIGDIQRAIIKNISLETQIGRILRKNVRVAYLTEQFDVIKQRMLDYRTECMPILDKNNNLANVYFWEDIFGKDRSRIESKLNLPVVIMAGGKGSRLKPITNIIPKPLIPLGEKTIVEIIMNKFIEVGCNNFFMSVNYRADFIKHYFKTLNDDTYKIRYFQEKKPLGTAGSLFLLKDKISTTFFVTNCDIIIEQDYREIYDYHKDVKNELTIVTALKHYKIPYGIIETSENGQLISLSEKPEYTFKINSGLYILEPHLLNEIPENKFFHITQIIEKIKKRNGKIGAFPISEKSWIDIGEWKVYLENI